MFTMYDSVELGTIPNQPHAVAAYLNGRYANYDEAKRRFPHARILGISVTGDIPADCYDVERGDYRPDEAAHLFQIARDHGIWRPCFYSSLNDGMAQVRASLNTVVTDRKDVRLWVAYYNGYPDLPSEFDAHQFTDRALRRNLDESICKDDFFRPAPKPVPPSPDIAEAKVGFDRRDGSWTVHPLPAQSDGAH